MGREEWRAHLRAAIAIGSSSAAVASAGPVELATSRVGEGKPMRPRLDRRRADKEASGSNSLRTPACSRASIHVMRSSAVSGLHSHEEGVRCGGWRVCCGNRLRQSGVVEALTQG